MNLYFDQNNKLVFDQSNDPILSYYVNVGNPTNLSIKSYTKSAVTLNWVNTMVVAQTEIYNSINGADSTLLYTSTPGSTSYVHSIAMSSYLTNEYKIRAKVSGYTSSFTTTKTINLSANKLSNTGAPGTTDWVDSNSDGVADGFSVSGSAPLLYSIVTGNSFNGNAQRFQSSTAYAWLNTSFQMTNGKTYYHSIKSRSGCSVGAYYYNLLNSGTVIMNLPNNSGSAVFTDVLYTMNVNSNGGEGIYTYGLQFTEVDEWIIREVTVT